MTSQSDYAGPLHLCKAKIFHLHQEFRQLSITRCLAYLTRIIGITILVTLTIRDFVPLLASYQEDNTAIQAEVIIVDDTFKPPQIMVQFPAYKVENRKGEKLWEIATRFRDRTLSDPNCTICRSLEIVGWDAWKDLEKTEYAISDVDTIYKVLSVAFVRRIYTSIKRGAEDVLDAKFSEWNEPIVSSALNFFMWQGNYDYYLNPEDEEYHGSLIPASWLSHTLDRYNDSQTIELLFSKILNTVCQVMNLVMENSDTTCADLLSNSLAPVCLDKDGLWLALPDLKELKSAIFKWTLLPSPNSTNSLWIPSEGQKQGNFWLYADSSFLYYSSDGGIFTNSIYEVPAEDGKLGHRVTVRYSVQMRAKETRPGHPCHNETTAAVCVNKCMSMWVIRTCGCVPFITKVGLDYDHSLPYCDPINYVNCDLDHSYSTSEIRHECRKQCKAACDYTAYSWRINHMFYIPDTPNVVEFTLRMYPVLNTFAQFNWIQKDTPEQFMSQVGGLVGGYLGLSAMSLLAFAIAFIQGLKRLILGKIQKSEKTQGDQMNQISELNSAVDLDKLRNLVDDVVRWRTNDLKEEIESRLMSLERTRGLKCCKSCPHS